MHSNNNNNHDSDKTKSPMQICTELAVVRLYVFFFECYVPRSFVVCYINTFTHIGNFYLVYIYRIDFERQFSTFTSIQNEIWELDAQSMAEQQQNELDAKSLCFANEKCEKRTEQKRKNQSCASSKKPVSTNATDNTNIALAMVFICSIFL